MARTFDASAPDFDARFRRFLREPRATGHDVAGIVGKILDEVEERGGEAVATHTAKFDELQIDPVTLTSDNVNLAELAAQCPDDLKQAIDFAHDRIAAYHRAQMPQDHSFTDEVGVELGWRWTSLDSVGVYVPGGRASYPSSVLMNVVPAKIAGVGRIVMVAPAPKGELSPAVAYAALHAGVDEYYPIGGAQAVAALAFGAGHLEPVDKIVGPGNAFVAEAKRQVFGRVGIDTIAGPSEILVIADETAHPDWVAADLLSQAEHDPSSQSILITVDESVGKAVDNSVDRQLKSLATAERAARSWSAHGAIVTARDLDQAAAVANIVAPEHAVLCVADPDALLPKIRHAGAVFLGHHTPEALGDYVTGSNHVLPTSRAARFSSGLGLADFMKRMSVQRASAAGFDALAPAALRLAEAERLPAHARSITIRTNAWGGHDG
ncbi:MAG: histidinol dehydrogenase [Hyphomonas sp.]|nr:histidinol dehydrogenase [Hyphomonas sp.]